MKCLISATYVIKGNPAPIYKGTFKKYIPIDWVLSEEQIIKKATKNIKEKLLVEFAFMGEANLSINIIDYKFVENR